METFDTLKASWIKLATPYCTNEALIQQEFDQLVKAYGSTNRHYHNLRHIYTLLQLQEQYAHMIRRPEIIQWAIFFHDVVYNVLKGDNEEKSALAAGKFLEQTNFPPADTKLVMDYIRATKSHSGNDEDGDLALFLDFDMAILGSPAAAYRKYAQQIRKEYSIYPELVYNPGRRKVLTHFLQSPVFRTTLFRELYETQARQNIQEELDTL
ncbi:hypothetical protein F0L74_11975 [Chitinophaga agrisoli]|uniref:Metal-dependent HD superfamily phosphohydrolase n=1 Tax=Chitinophaga agrisoli TaxID=2607653 RepID=A0A5B2VYG9_9BACT|nr:hypothetical protein [Chitinophaga agrisoli]KAA2243226.1 hypothetical protein F0L74_11975 [Chitinophaga agrisoli]